jgi:anhydro-N-acetylmuramic acid kinase
MPSPAKLVLGMMSGTSADGVDTALVRISGAPPELKIDLLKHLHQSFPQQAREEILRAAEQNPLMPKEFSQLHARLGKLYAEVALAACKKFRISPKKIDLIGNHGQTIFHQGPSASRSRASSAPVVVKGAGFGQLSGTIPSTLQLGDGSLIANLTGITTVSDFRPADIAQGGQGAPLVPFADYALYRHPELGRISLNIGGIANITVIPAGAKPSDVFAFDTGPGNMVIDALVQHFTHGRLRYDKNAALARHGHLSRELLAQLMRDPYFKIKPPKSTGREYFGANYVRKILVQARRFKLKPNDLIHTVTVFTAASVADALHRWVLAKHKIHQLIVSGGGAQNPLLLSQLAALLSACVGAQHVAPDAGKMSAKSSCEHGSAIEVLPSTTLAIPTDAKEALAFAILAYETFHQRPSNIPSATGARRPTILGKISYAPPR